MQIYERNEEALANEKARQDKQAESFGLDVDVLYLNPGSTMVRILPPYSSAGVFFREINKHRVPIGNSALTCACPAAMAGDNCLICDKGQALFETGDEASIKVAKDLRPRKSYLYNVLCFSAPADKKGEVPEFGKVYVLEVGVMTHRQILELDQDEAGGWADITDGTRGVNLMIKRTGQGLDTKYQVAPHGEGRTDIFATLAARNIDHTKIELFNLDKLYDLPSTEKLTEIVSRIQVFGAAAAPSPVAAPPAFRTAPPAEAVAPTPAAPTEAPAPAPAPAAAPVAPPQIPPPPTPIPSTEK